MPSDPSTARSLTRQRQLLLGRFKRWSEPVMTVLGLAWLALLVVELWRGLGPTLHVVSRTIWVVFLAAFLIEWLLAPRKIAYLRHNWLTALSLLAPALRLLRVARLARFVRLARVGRGMRLLKVLSAINRGLRALGRHMTRRGFPYVVAVTAVVTLAGAAGMFAFERDIPQSGITDFGSALWWTAMLMTTMGSESWPRSPEGRVLCLLLALYAFSVFGYVTATLASYFVDRDAQEDHGRDDRLDALRAEVALLRETLQRGAWPSSDHRPPTSQ